jgi:hypothetical protein
MPQRAMAARGRDANGIRWCFPDAISNSTHCRRPGLPSSLGSLRRPETECLAEPWRSRDRAIPVFQRRLGSSTTASGILDAPPARGMPG